MLKVSLDKAFGQTAILRNIAFDIAPGEVMALLGASGCGKTTLLRMMAGLEPPSAGQISGDITRPGPDIGYMAQSMPLAPWLSARRNTQLPLRLIGRAVTDEAADAVLADLALDGYADARPASLSGGMQQRVALASMLLLQPKLYLLDEPLSQLDIPLRRRVARIIREDIKARNAAVVIVTHSVEEALFIADRILVLGGTPATVQHRFSMRPHEGHDTLQEATAYHTVMSAIHDLAGAA